jgi:hypothetical protein
MSLLGTAIKGAALGAAAGAAGTLAMDAVWFSRYRRGGGTSSWWSWETAAGTSDYTDASAPAQTGATIVRATLHRDPPPGSARAMTNLVHWTTGVTWGAAYGKVTAIAGRDPHPIVGAAILSPVVWGSSYVALGLLGVYKPIWEYDVHTLWQDFSAHLAYGLTTAGTARALRGLPPG